MPKQRKLRPLRTTWTVPFPTARRTWWPWHVVSTRRTLLGNVLKCVVRPLPVLVLSTGLNMTKSMVNCQLIKGQSRPPWEIPTDVHPVRLQHVRCSYLRPALKTKAVVPPVARSPKSPPPPMATSKSQRRLNQWLLKLVSKLRTFFLYSRCEFDTNNLYLYFLYFIKQCMLIHFCLANNKNHSLFSLQWLNPVVPLSNSDKH